MMHRSVLETLSESNATVNLDTIHPPFQTEIGEILSGEKCDKSGFSPIVSRSEPDMSQSSVYIDVYNVLYNVPYVTYR